MAEISLRYACGCVDTWEVSQILEGEPEVIQSSHPCVPETCTSCRNYGRPCAARTAMGSVANYEPIQFAEVSPRRYVRMNRRG